ncbi:hypothetical protein C8R45DRAFT_583454 [Mycena sanguinolenta]|nr:hypothetical protein C8R45DRAFT_583454 [Mycena sanguinolenta]
MASSSALRARLEELDEELDALECKLRVLATERERVMHDLNSIVYPVLTLPPEITSEIFSHYVMDPSLGRSRKSTPGRGPLTLASVCQSWRRICFSTPRLWTSLRIYPNESWAVDDFLHLLKCWLQHTGSCPLDLLVGACAPTSTLSMKIFSTISHHSPQLHNLVFALAEPFSFPNDEIRGRLPLLTKLAVTINAKDDDTPAMLTAFREAPCLRMVRLTGASLHSISLPWIQLTRLEFWDESPSSCFQILKETPNLEVLVVNVPYANREPLLPHHLTLPHLRTLKFIRDHNGELLGHLVLPALKTIHLSRLRGPGGISSFIDLGIRSAWSLQSIHLTEMPLGSCTACLRSLPNSVAEVQIQDPAFTGVYLNELMTLLQEERGTLVPALQTLILHNCGTDFSKWRLGQMLASRLTAAHDGEAKLKSFRLAYVDYTLSKEFVQDLWEELRPMREAGLQVSIDVL